MIDEEMREEFKRYCIIDNADGNGCGGCVLTQGYSWDEPLTNVNGVGGCPSVSRATHNDLVRVMDLIHGKISSEVVDFDPEDITAYISTL